jgi:hypothetical protein
MNFTLSIEMYILTFKMFKLLWTILFHQKYFYGEWTLSVKRIFIRVMCTFVISVFLSNLVGRWNLKRVNMRRSHHWNSFFDTDSFSDRNVSIKPFISMPSVCSNIITWFGHFHRQKQIAYYHVRENPQVLLISDRAEKWAVLYFWKRSYVLFNGTHKRSACSIID